MIEILFIINFSKVARDRGGFEGRGEEQPRPGERHQEVQRKQLGLPRPSRVL